MAELAGLKPFPAKWFQDAAKTSGPFDDS